MSVTCISQVSPNCINVCIFLKNLLSKQLQISLEKQRFLPQTSSKHISRRMLTLPALLTLLLRMRDRAGHGSPSLSPLPTAPAMSRGRAHTAEQVWGRRAESYPAAGTLLLAVQAPADPCSDFTEASCVSAAVGQRSV